MRKVNFDIGAAASRGMSTDLHSASRVLEQYRHLLEAPDVLGMWVGAAASEPYIMLAVKENHGTQLSQKIPDTLDGVKVYYVEGRFRG